MQSLLRMSIRNTVKAKLGRTLYSITVYENVKSVTIPFSTNEKVENDDDEDSTMYLVLRLEKDSDHEQIITKKLLPFLKTLHIRNGD